MMTDMTITSSDRTFSRRLFVKGAGALIVAVGAPRLLNPKAAFAAVNGDFPIGPATIDPNLIDSWIAIGTDTSVTMKVGKVELGQGILTALAQLAADDLPALADAALADAGGAASITREDLLALLA